MTESATPPAETGEIVFEEGIIGVPRARRFVMLEKPGSPVRVLNCLDIEGFALPVVDPLLADPDYSPPLGSRVAEAIGADENTPVLLLAVASLEPDGTTANLRAPLVLNVRDRTAVQVILDDRSYRLRAPLQSGAETLRSTG